MTTRLSQEQGLRLAKETEWRQNYAHYGVHPGNLGYQEHGGMICGPLELSKAVVSAALLLRLLRGSDELTIHPTKNYPGCNGRRDARHSRIRRSCPCYRWLRTV